MANLLTVKLDVRKLDKTRFFAGKPDKNGHEPLWCDIVLIPRRELGKYGDTHLVKQSKKKDEEADMPIIGNATERVNPNQQAPRSAAPRGDNTPAARPSEGLDEDVPF